jgi:transcriptional regulator
MTSERTDKSDVLQGTLILLGLPTLEALGPQHGYGIARRIEHISKDVLQLNQGTLYPALLRMEQEGWISSRWGSSEKNRKAKFYSITSAGRRRLAKEPKNGGAEYQWHPDPAPADAKPERGGRGGTGHADPDGPPSRSTLTAAGLETLYQLTRASIIVLRGRISEK